MSNPAPIALFVYNRLEHTLRTVEALRNNELAGASDLLVFSDGPKNPADAGKVAAVRDFIRTIGGFKSVSVVERASNSGLASSIIDGVTLLCHRYGRGIVVEDDLLTSPCFLRFMNDALDLYEHEPRVICIHGYNYPIPGPLPETFFLRGADCWGWATWKRGWDVFDPDGRRLLAEIRRRHLEWEFDRKGSYPFTRMLRQQAEGKNSSWAVRWHASAFLADKLTLYPGRSLVRNIGFDHSGTHCGTHWSDTDRYATELSQQPVVVRPIPVEEDAAALAATAAFFRSTRPPFLRRVMDNIRRVAGI